MSAPRVLMLLEAFPPDYTGAGLQALALCKALQRRGQPVAVLCAGPEPGVAEDRVQGVPVTRLGVPFERRAKEFAMRAGRRLVRTRGDWDIVHVHGLNRAAYAGIACARVLGKRSVLKFTLLGSDDPRVVQEARLSALKLWALRRADRYIATSSALAEQVRNSPLDSDRLRIIPNGVELDRFAPVDASVRARLREELFEARGWRGATGLAVYCGSIEARKGLDTLAEAWKQAAARCPGARLLCVGPALPGNTGFAGRIERAFAETGGTAALGGPADDVADILHAADVFVLPSRAEGLPNALLEAQAAGLACIATDLPGVTTDLIAPEETGLLAPLDDAGALAAGLVRLFENESLRLALGRRARAAVQGFSIDAVADEYAALYERLMSGGRKVQKA